MNYHRKLIQRWCSGEKLLGTSPVDKTETCNQHGLQKLAMTTKVGATWQIKYIQK